MSTDRDATRIVRSWLKVEGHESADRVLDAVFDQLPATPQDRSWWPLSRYPLLSTTIRIAAAAAVVVLVVFLGYQFLPASNAGGPGPSPTPTSEPTAAPTASPTPATSEFPASGSMAIGRHSMTLSGVRLSIEITTAGWISNGEWGLDKGDLSTADSADFIFWPRSAPDNVFADPCGRIRLSPSAGPSAAELAAAVSSMPGINVLSGPAEVIVGGYPAQHVVLTLPDDLGCAASEFYLWEDVDNPGAVRYASQRGETFYVWIIDVDGTLVWIDGETYVTSSNEAAQEVRQIVDSIVFE